MILRLDVREIDPSPPIEVPMIRSKTLDRLWLHEAALWYAGLGFPVFPCKPRGKEPLTLHGFKDATTDRVQITNWWTQWPEANIGVPTGAAFGLLVMDVDPRNGGDHSLNALLAKYGPLPATAEQLTGGGGRHFFFRYAGGPVPKGLAAGIDLKGDGGYVMVAPSLHPIGKAYEWGGIEGPWALQHPAEAPAWLLEHIYTARNGRTGTNPEGDVTEKWGQGQRNNKLTSLAGTMRRLGMSQSAMEAALLEGNGEVVIHHCRKAKSGKLPRAWLGTLTRIQPEGPGS
jgi:hypothetical protein